jgi:hypothetical protein
LAFAVHAGGVDAIWNGDLDLMSRTRCGAKCCFAEPGSTHAAGPRISNASRRESDVLHRIRGTQRMPVA